MKTYPSSKREKLIVAIKEEFHDHAKETDLKKVDMFCFHKGKFFVLMNTSQKGGKWIAMGPDRKVSIPFTILLLLASLLVRFVFQRLPSAEFGWFLVISYAVTIVSYLYTSLCDPGIIRPSEDNSEENKNSLEPLGYTYCTICGVYRPPGAYHCSD
ncbi:hypothetical protein AV274_1842 [Blastocystis sp. ATCC 50177/Nand II]|uniref:Uncharacterized protein n=1 Tax=Blastocystis sp. subtype 1 (strain ATCC 50177 / NandII) TaxID=478820 RepID=A0A196SHC9_BLAHN|nr:hypothetical protein AV274_1842 [Blastocystis sp. ATCC 50177/Nand II]